MPSKADEIRAYALEKHVRPWRRSDETRLAIRAGDVVRGMRLQTPHRTYAVPLRAKYSRPRRQSSSSIARVPARAQLQRSTTRPVRPHSASLRHVARTSPCSVKRRFRRGRGSCTRRSCVEEMGCHPFREIPLIAPYNQTLKTIRRAWARGVMDLTLRINSVMGMAPPDRSCAISGLRAWREWASASSFHGCPRPVGAQPHRGTQLAPITTPSGDARRFYRAESQGRRMT